MKRRFSLLNSSSIPLSTNGNYLIEGYTTGRSILRSVTFQISPGAAAGTNINITAITNSSYNAPSLSDATDLALDSTSGSYSLNAGSGNVITVSPTENVVGILSVSIIVHDINSSSQTETYVGHAIVVSNEIALRAIRTGATGGSGWLGIMDSGDRCDILVAFVTDS